jgi:hypothetical protein
VADSVDAQPTLLDGEDVPAADLRRDLPGAVLPSAGIVRGLDVQALPTPDMRVRLPAGLCMVDDEGGGLVPLYLTTQTDLDIAASSSTLSRIDSVIGEVVDTGDGDTLIRRFRVITGTPASSPTAPALPPSDQPTAYTLRLANVTVRANAETNGKIRSQDVSVVAPVASLVPRPVKSDFVSAPGFGTTSSWVDFTSGQWPAVTLKVPASGIIKVTISAGNISNSNTETSTIRIAYRISGSDTVSADPTDSKCVLATGGADTDSPHWISASRTTYFSGLTPGGSITVTPQWRISSGSSSTCTISAGQLLVEPVA